MQVTCTQFETFLFKSYNDSNKSTRSRKSFHIKTSTYFIQIMIPSLRQTPDSWNAQCSSRRAAMEGAGRVPPDPSLPVCTPGPTSPPQVSPTELAGFTMTLKWWGVRGQTGYRNVSWSFPNVFQN